MNKLNYLLKIGLLLTILCTVFTTLPIDNLFAQTTCTQNSMILTDGQTFVIPAGVTEVFIEVEGARGGNGIDFMTPVNGGGGATVVGTFSVVPTNTLLAIVGVIGEGDIGNAGAAGGGGSAVINSTTGEVLAVAGGGGGGSRDTGGDGIGGGVNFQANNGMIIGAGGGSGTGNQSGGGGGGFNDAGTAGTLGGGGGGAGMLTGGGAGGVGQLPTIDGGAGFGGGGGGGAGGGGGGGYNGGAGGSTSVNPEAGGDGGDSFFNNTRNIGTPTNTQGNNNGAGSIRVCWATPSTGSTATATAPIPTMSQWGLLIFGLLIMNVSVFFVKRMELI